MPHQCVRCNAFYKEGSNEIIKGCTTCGGRLFFYIKKEHLEQQKEITQNLTEEDKKKIENDIYNLLEIEEEEPVILDLESIRVKARGKYDIDLVKLFNQKHLIIKLEEGKYIIDLPETFRRMKT